MRYFFILMMSMSAFSMDNQKIVEDFYKQAFVNGNVTEAIKYLHEDYIQHNPKVATGKAGFLAAFKNFDPTKYTFSIKRVIAHKNMVMLHTHAKKGKNDNGTAVVDIFRVEEGKITEHWDVMQDVPDITVHSNTMF